MNKFWNMQIPYSQKETKGLLHNQEVMNGMETDSGIQSLSNLQAVC